MLNNKFISPTSMVVTAERLHARGLGESGGGFEAGAMGNSNIRAGLPPSFVTPKETTTVEVRIDCPLLEPISKGRWPDAETLVLQVRENMAMASVRWGALSAMYLGLGSAALTFGLSGSLIGAISAIYGVPNCVFGAAGMTWSVGASLVAAFAPEVCIRWLSGVDPERMAVQIREGVAAMNEGDLRAARLKLDAVYRVDPELVYSVQPDICRLLGALAEYCNDRAGAESIYCDWVKFSSDDPDAIMARDQNRRHLPART